MEIRDIPVTDSRGRRIGTAKLEKDDAGIKAHMILDSDVGHMLMHGMRDDMVQGLSLSPVIEPTIKAQPPATPPGHPIPIPRRLQPFITPPRHGVGYIPPGMQRDWPVIGKARIDVDDQGVITHFEFFTDKE